MRYILICFLSLLAARATRAQEIFYPENPLYHTLTEWGVMQGEQPPCPIGGKTEAYGAGVVALGDVNNDGLQDWAVSHLVCDTSVAGGRFPNEWLIYHGVRGGLPPVSSGKRFAPSEFFSQTTILCAGDWNGDGNRDIAANIKIFGDTSSGNTRKLEIATLVIYWGQPDGNYAPFDTTRLSNGTEKWDGASVGLSVDIDHDSVSDLVIYDKFGSGFSAGRDIPTPQLMIFRGHKGRRWGRSDDVPRTPDWGLWNAPLNTMYAFRMSTIDQDCDGNADIVFIDNQNSMEGHISVLYGRAGQLPDTNDLQTIDLTSANGKQSILSDVTGDGIPEILTNCGLQETIKIYAGAPGQRLIDQYGSGNDPADTANGRLYRRPWLTISTPVKVNESQWLPSGFESLIDVGDIGRDGINDFATFSDPFMIFYNGGPKLDLMIDAEYRFTSVSSFAILGDIDGSHASTFVLGYYEYPGGLVFIKATDSVPNNGVGKGVPHAKGFRCKNLPAGIDEPSITSRAPDPPDFHLCIVPNPTHAACRVEWEPVSHLDGMLTLSAENGADVRHLPIPASADHLMLSTTSLALGHYFITVRIGAAASTLPLEIR